MPRRPVSSPKVDKSKKIRWVNTNPVHPEGYARYYVLGKTGAGKTTFTKKLVKHLIKKYDMLVVISPTAKYDQIMINLFQELEERDIPVKLFSQFSKPQTHNIFMHILEQNRENHLSTLIVIDDPIGNNAFTRSVNSDSHFNQLTANLKHYRATIIYNSQVCGGMSRTARLNQECFIFFANVGERKEMQQMVSFLSVPEFNRLMNKYANSRHTALWFNIQYGGLGVYAMDAAMNVTPISEA